MDTDALQLAANITAAAIKGSYDNALLPELLGKVLEQPAVLLVLVDGKGGVRITSGCQEECPLQLAIIMAVGALLEEHMGHILSGESPVTR